MSTEKATKTIDSLGQVPAALSITESEEKAIRESIRGMVRRFKRESIPTDKPREVLKENQWARGAVDKIIADALTLLKIDVSQDPAEKLFEVLSKVPGDQGDSAGAIRVLSYRYYDTMEAMVSYKKRFRGKELTSFKYSKEEALRVLRERGLTRR